MNGSILRTLLGAATLAFLAPVPTDAQPTRAIGISVIASRFALLCPHQIVKSFPTGGPAETSWRICWNEVAGDDSISNPNGLAIGPVDFKPSSASPWRRVLWDMRISDFFVPYHDDSNRFYDLSFYNFQLSPLPPQACPAALGGAMLSPHVCREVRDRGIDWMDEFNALRRGEELTLWGAIDAANYRYLESYSFRDDGAIVAETGATGRNFPGSETIAHAHNALWRIDLDVDGTVNDPTHERHLENPVDPAGTATDPVAAIATASGFDWAAQTHDSLVFSNSSVVNAQGHHPAYHLTPLVNGGLTRHFEDFTHHDFWVTPFDPTQMAGKDLAAYVAGAAAVDHRDIVAWYKGSLHHEPRDEDGVFKGGIWHGTAHAWTTGLTIEPVDVFDCSPFYGGC